jgi:DNA-binding GntR family transcriptional regulator
MDNASKTLARNNRKSLSAKVHDYLLGQISDQTISPGTILKRRVIADELHVSYAPVTEAFVQLEIEGYLITTPRKGTMVRQFGVEEIRDNLLLREALECEAARLYCGKPVTDHYEELMQLAKAIDATFLQVKPKNWQLEYAFHSRLVFLSGSPLLLSEFNRIMKLGSFYELYSSVFTEPDKNHVLDPHQDLLNSLCKATSDEAEQSIRRHLRTSSEFILEKQSLRKTLENKKGK